jgi:hypothetical protein
MEGVSAILSLYAVLIAAAIALYLYTRCPYESLEDCKAAASEECGPRVAVLDAADCRAAVEGYESCYCHFCRYCLDSEKQARCQRPVEERVRECEAQLKT